jgi:Fe-S-cluster containining protein
MELETDLELLGDRAVSRRDENLRFRAFLKKMNGPSVDSHVHRLNQEISSEIDCTSCGNCCRAFLVSVDYADRDRLCSHLQMDRTELDQKYLEKSQMGHFVFSHIPCSFLSGNTCSVYEARPEDCRSYPNLHKDDINSHLLSIMGSYGICPIVYNVMETLKEETGFDRKDPTEDP